MNWGDLDKPKGRLTPQQAEQQRRLDLLFGRVFGTPDGLEVLALLRSGTVERMAGPDISERALYHLEGQRQLVRVIEQRTANGRDQHPSELRRSYPALVRRSDD